MRLRSGGLTQRREGRAPWCSPQSSLESLHIPPSSPKWRRTRNTGRQHNHNFWWSRQGCIQCKIRAATAPSPRYLILQNLVLRSPSSYSITATAVFLAGRDTSLLYVSVQSSPSVRLAQVPALAWWCHKVPEGKSASLPGEGFGHTCASSSPYFRKG